MLSLLKLPPQQDRDAVVILYMGGTFGDKFATLGRFRHNYTTRLLPAIRARLVLENDDVSWSVHDLLPICEELSIPLVLDYHHHNIIFDSRSVREGTLDISAPALADRIAATWACNRITQEMHYSEARPGAVTPRERRKHANRVATLPPCPPGVDLLVLAKDNEQAVFDLMRTFKLPGFEKINDMIPHEREDDHKPSRKVPKKRKRKDGGDAADSDRHEDEGAEKALSGEDMIAPEEVAMGGPLNRVYWPVGMEYWISPKKKSKKAK
jgi:UV DNA damage endonuclease